MSATTTASRRRVLTGLALGGPALVLAAACATGGAAPTADVRLHTDWTSRPGGSTPDVGDDGVPFRVTREGAAPAPTVADGALEARLPDTGASSSSIAQEMRARVRRIGATFAFGAGSAAGALTLAAWTGVPFVDASCLLVLTPSRWSLAVVEQGTLRVVGQDAYGAALPQDGTTPSTVDVTIAADTATLRLPDGGSAAVTDPRVGATLATVPCWQFYKNSPGGADARLLRTWAG